MNNINPKQEFVDSFSIVGMSVTTQNKDEFDPKTAKIPALWKRFSSANPTTAFGVYTHYESDEKGLYTYTVGTLKGLPNADTNSAIIHAGNYLVFTGIGPRPHAIIETWKQIWAYFSNETSIRRRFLSDFERYDSPEQVSIYIGIY